MKKTYFIFLLILSILLNACFSKTQDSNNENLDTIEKPYLGQIPPGLTPIPFAPGIVSTEIYEYDGAFSKDMKAFYFIRRGEEHKKSAFYEYKYKDNSRNWEKSEIASPWIGRPVIAPNGKTMHLGDKYLKITDSGWSELQKLDPPTISNDSMYIMRLSSSANGTYYFDTYKENDPSFPIRYSRLINGKHEEPKALPKVINSGTFLSHPFIAPDESYLLFDAKREDGFGDSDIYISFKQKDGSWGDAINLGDKINTKAWEASASITPDGKYLFFSRNVGSNDFENVDIFWVDAQVVMSLKNNPESLVDVLNSIWKTEQEPIRNRDSLISKYGVDSELVKKQQLIIDKNHTINEKKVLNILQKYGWPTKEMAGERGNWTICNVIQHSDNKVRIQYLPMMRKAVKDKKLEPRFLVRAEDRIATERGDLQIYGGQMKYYPKTKSFNLWPVFDPKNIDKRRTAIGLDSIAIFLKNRFNFEWNLEEQIKRTKEFELAKKKNSSTKK